LRRAIRLGVALAAAAAVLLHAAAAPAADLRAELRAAGGDRDTAVRVARALLARPLALQLTRVRCERVGAERFCGLTLSGVKFHRRVDTASFDAEVERLVRGAFATEPLIAEVDLWVTVPLSAGRGAVVSGDFAQPSSATVFATTVPRDDVLRAATGKNVFWDPAFRRELAGGSTG
jgi:hypothetical protein